MSSPLNASEQLVTTALFERILEAPRVLVALRGVGTPSLLEQLRLMARHGGQAIYLWRPGVGLSSLREAHAQVPGCLRLSEALRYIQHSPHFGVYLLEGLPALLSVADLALLRQLAGATTAHPRRIVLLDAAPSLLASLRDAALVLDAGELQPTRPRLRDGRWLL